MRGTTIYLIYFNMAGRPTKDISSKRKVMDCGNEDVAAKRIRAEIEGDSSAMQIPVVAASHNELWQPNASNSHSVTSQMLWPPATVNCGSKF